MFMSNYHLQDQILKHYSDITWVSRCFTSLLTQLFHQQLDQANVKMNIKALHYWPFVGEIHGGMLQSPSKG